MNRICCSILLTIFFCYSCGQKNNDIISHAEQVLLQHPDSALILLSEIDFPEELSGKQLADYEWIKAMAHMKQDIALNNDSLILFSLDYYKSHSNEDKLASTYKLAIYHSFWDKDIVKVSDLIEEGLQLAYNQNDSAAIADLYLIKTEIQPVNEAISSYREAKKYNNLLEAGADYSIALKYANSGNVDSAKYYFEKSIETACRKQEEDASHYIRNYGDYLYALKDTKGALREMKRALSYDPHYANSGLYNSISLIYLNENKIDSAQYYLNKAKEVYARKEDKESPAYIASNNMIFSTQVMLDYAKGQHIDNHKFMRYNDSLRFAIDKDRSLLEEQWEIKSLLEQQNLKLKIKQQHTQLLLITLFSVLIISAFLFYIYIRNKKQKLQETEEKNETLRRLLNDATRGGTNSEQDPDFFKKVLLQQLGLIRLIATSPTTQNQALLQQISLITNDKLPTDSLLVWDDLYPLIDSIYNNFYIKMHSKYTTILTEKEMQLCCLLAADFSTKEISVITQQSVRTIYQRKTTIRQKLGMDEKGDIVDFIQN